MATQQFNQLRAARIATMIVFLALIRCISEVFRLNYYGASPFTYELIKPFLIGGVVCAVALLIMTLCSYRAMHKTIIALAILAVVSLLAIKAIYLK